MIIPQTVLVLRGSNGVGLVPRISHIWSRGAAGELPARMPPLSHSQDGLGQGWLKLKWAKGQF